MKSNHKVWLAISAWLLLGFSVGASAQCASSADCASLYNKGIADAQNAYLGYFKNLTLPTSLGGYQFNTQDFSALNTNSFTTTPTLGEFIQQNTQGNQTLDQITQQQGSQEENISGISYN